MTPAGYRQLFEQHPDVMLVCDVDTLAVLASNQAAQRLYGYSAAEFSTLTFRDLGPDVPSVHAAGDAVRTTRHRSKAGREFPVEVVERPLRWGRRAARWFTITAASADRSPSTGMSVVQAPFEYKQLFDEMIDGFALHELIVDSHGRPVDYRFLAVNPAFERLSGLKAAEIVGRTVLEVLPGTDPWWIETYGKVALTGEPVEFERWHPSLNRCFKLSAFRTSAMRLGCVFVDITAQKQAEASLRTASRAIEHSPVSVIITDVNGSIEYVNPFFTHTTGYTLDEVRGHKPWEFSLAGVRNEELWAAVREGRDWKGEQHNRKKDGTLFWEAATVGVIHGEDGKVTQYVMVKEDITHRRDAAAALAASELRFRSLIENVPKIAIQVFDKERHVIFWNAASERLYGYTREEALGQRMEDLGVPDEMRQRVIAAFQAFVERDEPIQTDELDLHRKDGRLVHVYFTTLKLLGANGEPEFHSIQVDMTARKEAEERIREQAALLDVVQDAILVTELDGTVTYWNRGAELMYDIPASEACGRRFEELAYREVPPDFNQHWNTLLKTGDWDGENKHVSRSGRVFDIRGRAKVMLTASGQPSAALLIFSDVTESKRLEAQFLRAQRLESVGSLASGIAHDLNNVLTPILMSVELLRPMARSAHDAEMLQLLTDSARRGSDIVQQLLLFGRGSDSPRSRLNVAGVIRDIGRMIRETFPKNLTISVRTPSDLRLVQADRTQLEQVLLNLCVNARDAMPHGGSLTVEAENVEVGHAFAVSHGAKHMGSYVRIDVKDTGMGIAPELLDKIFDPFFTTKPTGEGTGLGLATVAGILRSHEGFVDVQSEVGHGTVFTVFLPAALSCAEAGIAGCDSEDLKGDGELVLVIEDEESIRTVLQRALEAANYRVLTAGDGAEALGVFDRNVAAVRLVVTDLMMPVMDGVQAVRNLRRLSPDLPVVAISGLEQAHRADMESIAGPRVRFLPKPFSVDHALREVKTALRESRPSKAG